MKIYRQETYVSDAGVSLIARTPVDEGGFQIGPTTFHATCVIPIAVPHSNGEKQVVQVDVFQDVAGATVGEALGNFPAALEIAKVRAMKEVEEQVKKANEASMRSTIASVAGGLAPLKMNGHPVPLRNGRINGRG